MSWAWTIVIGLICIVGLQLEYIGFTEAILLFVGLAFILPLIVFVLFILGAIILVVI